MTTKLSRTIYLVLALFFAILTVYTSSEWYESLSHHASANNFMVYNLMHIFSAVFFFANGYAQQRMFDYVIGAGMLGILITNVNYVPNLHNVVTVLTLLCTLFSMLYFTEPKNKIVNLFLAVATVTVFLLGYLSDKIYFAFAEIVCMFVIGVHMMRRVWIGHNQ